MGVFERQDCNYEHVFGQASLTGRHVDAFPAPQADTVAGPRNPGKPLWNQALRPAM